MNLTKKILLILIMIIFAYVFSCLLQARTEGLQNNQKSGVVRYPISHKMALMPITQYVIKSSYNTAYTGPITWINYIFGNGKHNKIRLQMIDTVLETGCRFLDFEVYYIKDMPCVAYSNDPTYQSIDSDNTILLDNVLTHTVANAFSKPINKTDPLFIHLRIKPNNNEEELYKAVATSIHATLIDKLYRKQLNKNTKLNDLLGKVVIVIDKTINREYESYANCDNEKGCYDLKQYVAAESGSDFFRLNNETILKTVKTPPYIHDDNRSTTVDMMSMIEPVKNLIYNPSINEYVLNYGCQIVCYKYYINDKNLEEQENVFNENAFVPISSVIENFNKNQ